MSALVGLDRTNLRELAVDSLRRAITSGEIAPGTHMVETDLSERLGISRGTLREAMRQLQQEGLLESGARGRLSVRNLDAREIEDIFLVRGALEALAARLIISAGTIADAKPVLQAAIERMREAEGGSVTAWIEADLDFHRALVSVPGNATLVHQWQQLEGSIRMSIMYAGLDRATANMDTDRHSDMVDAIATGDEEHAVHVIRSHMMQAAATLTA